MENLRGAAWMTAAMLGFAIEDMFIKLLAGSLPTWQIILILGIGGAASFAVAARTQGHALITRAVLSPAVLLRNVGEILATLSFVTALALIPISTASAVLQATPLVVTMGAALFLGERVGWRRWTAILVGFLGVLLVIRPGVAGFDIYSLFALLAVIGLAIRDLATRRVPNHIASTQLSFWAFLVLIPAALILGQVSGTPAVLPQSLEWLYISIIVPMGVFAYYAIVAAMRVGEISFVTPFRYSRILFALLIGMVIFSERPNALMLTGAALIVASGLFTLWRERKKRPAA